MKETKQRRTVPDEDDMRDGITFDLQGRMNYHPEYHTNHRTRFSVDELVYMCKYYDIDGPRSVAFALGRTEHTVMCKISELRKQDTYNIYKYMSDDDWLLLIADLDAS